MEVNTLIDKLDTIGCVVNNDIRNINCGGCCVFASIIVEKLTSLGIRSRGIVVDYSGNKNSLAFARNFVVNDAGNLDEWNQAGINFNHVAVEFVVDGTRYHYDTNGVTLAHRTFRCDTIHAGRLKLKELKALASAKHGWNPSFNRDNIPLIKEIVDSEFAV